jgi:hypothetical protein
VSQTGHLLLGYRYRRQIRIDPRHRSTRPDVFGQQPQDGARATPDIGNPSPGGNSGHRPLGGLTAHGIGSHEGVASEFRVA